MGNTIRSVESDLEEFPIIPGNEAVCTKSFPDPEGRPKASPADAGTQISRHGGFS